MANIDETIVENLNEYKKGSYGDIENGYYIKEEHVTFHREYFFENRFSVILPENFIDLPEAIAKLKYPSEQRPKVIKSDREGGINFAFNLVDGVELEGENVPYVVESMLNGLKNMNPAFVFGDKGTIELGYTKLSWFEFQSTAFDGTMYNVMYCLPVSGKMMHGVFNCFYQDKDAWKKVVLEVMASIQDETRQM